MFVLAKAGCCRQFNYIVLYRELLLKYETRHTISTSASAIGGTLQPLLRHPCTFLDNILNSLSIAFDFLFWDPPGMLILVTPLKAV